MCTMAGFAYFGFECPHAGGMEVHCECSNSINLSDKIDDRMCQKFVGGCATHCTGPFVVDTAFGTYYMGSDCINSGYSISPGSCC